MKRMHMMADNAEFPSLSKRRLEKLRLRRLAREKKSSKIQPSDIVSVKRRTEHGEVELTGETRKIAIQAAQAFGILPPQ